MGPPARKIFSRAFWRIRPAGRTVALSQQGSAALPGRHITDRQKRLFMTLKKTDTIEVAAARLQHSASVAGL